MVCQKVSATLASMETGSRSGSTLQSPLKARSPCQKILESSETTLVCQKSISTSALNGKACEENETNRSERIWFIRCQKEEEKAMTRATAEASQILFIKSGIG